MKLELELIPLWEDLQRDFVEPGIPHKFVLRSDPGLHIFTDEAGQRIGARFELPPGALATSPSLLQQIAAIDVTLDGKRWLEISTASPALFGSFYKLVGQVTERVVAGGLPHDALGEAVSLWETLVSQAEVLSEERQAGLFGELLLLERLILAGTQQAVSTWVGPAKEAHDFRWMNREFEVKTTSGSRRLHKIHGVTQLSPSVSAQLYLVSVQIADGGNGGRSLPDLVNNVRGQLQSDELPLFNSRLEAAGYNEVHAPHYSRRRRLRTPLVLIPVGTGVPRIVPDTMAHIPQDFSPERIGRIDYDIDVTGLGHEDGTQEFLAVIPATQGAAS